MGKEQEKQTGYALITGATGGLGKAFVYALAKRGYPLILTGRSLEKLTALQAEIKEKFPGITILSYPADLSSERDRYALREEIVKGGCKISFLANVAGVDVQKGLTEYTEEKLVFQCRVNFEAAVSMCRFAIENRAERLQILNVSSVSGVYPMPYFAIYSATKGALTSFSVALRQEMKGEGVNVTTVLPGAIPTREDIKKQIKEQGLWGKLAAKSPEKVAEAALKAVAKNRRKRIIGFWNKLLFIATGWLPLSFRLAFIAKRWGKISKDAF